MLRFIVQIFIPSLHSCLPLHMEYLVMPMATITLLYELCRGQRGGVCPRGSVAKPRIGSLGVPAGVLTDSCLHFSVQEPWISSGLKRYPAEGDRAEAN